MRNALLLSLVCLLGCKEKAIVEAPASPVVEKAQKAQSCEDLESIYDENHDEVMALWKGLKEKGPEAVDPKLSKLVDSCSPATEGSGDCGCPLSKGQCAMFFFGCLGGDEPSCCWFDSCWHRTNVRKCHSVCSVCSQWSHNNSDGEGPDGGAEE
jgi:hypothetical protein